MRIDLKQVVGKGYGTFWNYKGRYRVIKGSRASKKSKTMALWLITSLVQYKGANALVVRKTYRTLKDSCYSELKWAVSRLKLDAFFTFKESPLEITFNRANGEKQKIYFRGLDDPLKVTSITVENGYLCFLWVEEAYEITSEKDFNMLDESIRGSVPETLFKQVTLTLNPWSERHWIKKRFFDNKSSNVLALTTNYKCNEWLDKADIKLFEDMKINNPRRYQVAGLGNWGIVDGLVYENWSEQDFNKDKIKGNIETFCGLDFGYTNDPTAYVIGFIDTENKIIYIYDEIYKKGLSNKKIYEEIKELGYEKERITADSAEPKSIDELREYGLRIKGAKKGKDSIMNGIQYLQDFKIIIHPRCVNFITEISNYAWDKDKFGNVINRPIDDFNHLMDALRYGIEQYIVRRKWIY